MTQGVGKKTGTHGQGTMTVDGGEFHMIGGGQVLKIGAQNGGSVI